MASLAIGAVSAFTGLIGGILKHHKQAVMAEAASLNQAVPAWRQVLAATIDGYNQGAYDAPTALSYLDQGKDIYYQYVRSIIRGRPPAGGCRSVDPSGATCPGPRIDPCNGPCSIAWFVIEPEWYEAKKAITKAETTGEPQEAYYGPVEPHAGFNGIGGYQVTIQRPSAIATQAGAILGAVGLSNLTGSQKLLAAGVGILLLILLIGAMR